ncbi:hypothetical protein [Curtobacterium sp. MCBD17_040]|uniref:hypothetical protein n=1 Tax=Curtobacterium sp. MCBD17_040 TaxID=2175674 RepID=UPI000DAA707E|nr:hypothetical protein [Curtobacterium sp. MCBD17_040]WIB65856.1 hypothetical protein DEI94_17225 [Curtobacterium sp. MCBD17_040]
MSTSRGTRLDWERPTPGVVVGLIVVILGVLAAAVTVAHSVVELAAGGSTGWWDVAGIGAALLLTVIGGAVAAVAYLVFGRRS